MEYKKFGNTDLSVSELGMGTIQITRLPWEESLRVVREVIDLGVNWFDTAHGYGDSEQRLGDAFEGRRDEVLISTKSGSKDPEEFSRQFEESLRKLKTDHVDILYFHGAGAVESGEFEKPNGLLERALRFVEQGKARYLGVSAHRPHLAVKALEYPPIEVAMVPANYINREYIDGEFMAKARERGVAVVAMKPFGGGRIRSAGPNLRFLQDRYPDIFPCVGIETPAEMREDIAIWDEAKGFTREDEEELERHKAILGDKFCRMCGYCLPCPEGIPIPTVNFLEVFSMQMPRERVVNEKHAEAVEKARGCTSCRACVAKCPYDLEIPEMLKRGIAFYEEFSART